jgi:hypothetical protein
MQVTAISSSGDDTQILVAATDGGVFYKRRVSHEWSNWYEIHPKLGARACDVACTSRLGYHDLFVLCADGRIMHSRFGSHRPPQLAGKSAHGSWSHWTTMPGPPGDVMAIAATAMPGGAGMLIAVSGDKVIHDMSYGSDGNEVIVPRSWFRLNQESRMGELAASSGAGTVDSATGDTYRGQAR